MQRVLSGIVNARHNTPDNKPQYSGALPQQRLERARARAAHGMTTTMTARAPKKEPTTPVKLAVFSVSAGAGHVRAAQALCAEAQLSHPDWQVTHIDVMDLVPRGFRTLYAESYIKLVEHAPLLWSYLYARSDKRTRASTSDRLRRGVEKLNTRQFDGRLEELSPDAIICTHFLPAELLSRRIRKRRPTPPVWVQVTDFDVHGLWLHDHLHGYFAANDEVAQRLHSKGVALDRLAVTGIPIMPAFSNAPARSVAAVELGIDPVKPTVLMMSGGAGVGGIDVLASQLAAIPADMQILALAGRNDKLLSRLRSIAKEYPRRLWPMGFTSSIERIMAAADLAITKPGGLTSSECLAMNLPMIVVSPIPGQEERNADFLLESGAALKAVDSASLIYKVRRLLDNPQELALMRSRMQRVARPQAAVTVLAAVARHLQNPRSRQ
jgi:processive 1,2-diacylglycerol beta-glucosyltransferase